MNKELRKELMYNEFNKYLDGSFFPIKIENKRDLVNIMKALFKLGFTYYKDDYEFNSNLEEFLCRRFYETPPWTNFVIIVEFYKDRNNSWMLKDYALDYLYMPLAMKNVVNAKDAMIKLKKISIKLKNIEKIKKI